MKKLISIFLVTTLLTGMLVGCGGKEETVKDGGSKTEKVETKKEEPKKEEIVEITWWNYPTWDLLDGEPGKYEKENIIKPFNEKYPNIKVNLEMISFQGGPEKVNVAIASNTAPDLVYDYPGRIIDYAKKGVMVDLNDLMKNSEFESDVPDNILAACKSGDDYYMYPHNTVGFIMGVNKSIFEEIGAVDLLQLDKEDRLWSTDEFTKALEAVRDSGKDIYPTAFYSKNTGGDQGTRAFVENIGGGRMMNDEMTKFRINEPEGVAGLQWVIDGIENGLVAPGPEAMTSNDCIDLYMQGKAATVIIYSPVLKKIFSDKKATDFEEIFMPWPTPKGDGTDQRIGPHIGGMGVFDNGDEKRIEAAKALVDFISNDPSQITPNIVNCGGFSVRKSRTGFYDDAEMSYAEQLTKYGTIPELLMNNFAEMRTVWFPNLQEAVIGRVTPGEAMDKFVEQATEVINKK